MELPPLGHLDVDPRDSDVLTSGPVQVPLAAGRAMSFHFYAAHLAKPALRAAFGEAVGRFLALTPADRVLAGRHLYRWYRVFRDAYGVEELGGVDIPDAGRVWGWVTPSHLIVSGGPDNVVVALQAGCAWDEEHGVELLYRHGKELVGVGAQGSTSQNLEPLEDEAEG